MKRQAIAMAFAAAVTLTLAPLATDARPHPRAVPRVVVAPPPSVYLVPGFMDVFFYRAGATDVFFAAGLWWTAVDGIWYRAAHWQGPWLMVGPQYVPAALVRLPPRWHKTWHRWDRVPWRRVEANRHVRHAPRPAVRPDQRHRAPARVEQKAPPRASQKQPARQMKQDRRGNDRAPARTPNRAQTQNRPAARR